jgi:hypothetical protein
LLPLGALALIMLLVFISSRRTSASRIAVMSVGMCSFIFQLSVLLSYQSYTGLLYYGIALLTALFMAGAALGAGMSLARVTVGKRDLRLFHAGFVICAFLLLGWYYVPGRESLPSWLVSALLYAFSCGVGVLTGAYYPVVVRTALPGGVPPALFYAWDLFGACIGGFLGGVLIFPLAGIVGAVAFIVFIHIASSFLLVGKW